MAKLKIDVLKKISEVDLYMGLGLAYGIQFLGSLMKNEYIGGVCTTLLPGLVMKYVSKNKLAQDSASISGFALGLRQIVIKVLTDLFQKEKDSKKKTAYLEAMGYIDPAYKEMFAKQAGTIQIESTTSGIIENVEYTVEDVTTPGMRRTIPLQDRSRY